MGKFVINGGRKLSGKIRCESAKNAVLPILASTILTKEKTVIKNCPKIQDVLNMIKILQGLGVKTCFEGDDLVVDAKVIDVPKIQSSLGKELRSSIFLLGALIARCKKAEVGYPGGCDIGLRPIDLHLESLKKLNVSINESFGEITCSVDKLKGNQVYLDFPSVGATENIMIAATLAIGKTEIKNAAKEPEIVDLMMFLNSMGAKVYGAGTSTILIDGVEKLHGTTFVPMSDRIEAGTFLIAAAITGGEIEVAGCQAKNISSLIHKFCDNTCKITINNDIIYLKSGVVKKPFTIETGPYPCFPTDLQAPVMSLAAVSKGVSVITENVFEMRYKHVPELIKMGASITVKGRTALVRGVERFHCAEVSACDLRGGASLVLAGLGAEGKTTVNNIYHIDRGYFGFEKKLKSIGADVYRIN